MQHSDQFRALPFRPLATIPSKWDHSSVSPSQRYQLNAPQTRQLEMEKDASEKALERSFPETEPISVGDIGKASDLDLADVGENEDEPNDQKEQSVVEQADRFHQLFQGRAFNGFIVLGELAGLLAEVTENVSDADIKAAIHRVLGPSAEERGRVNYDDAHAVLKALEQEGSDDGSPFHGHGGGCLARWADQMSDSKATNVLLGIVVVVSFISAALAAGLAIMFMFNTSMVIVSNNLQEDLGTVRDIVNVFEQNIFVKEVNERMLTMSAIIASVTDLVSYKSTLQYNLRNLESVVTFLTDAIAAWWIFIPEQSYTDLARVMALWLDAAMTSQGRQQAFQMVNDMQHLLPEGFEILLGQWTDATNTSIQFLTDFRFKDQCLDGVCGSDAHATAVSPMRAAMAGIEGAMRGLDYRPHEVLVGYTSIAGVGLEYKSDIDIDIQAKYNRMQAFFDDLNLNAQDSREFLLGRLDISTGQPVLLTKLRSCDMSCAKHTTRPTGPLGLALAQQSGTMELTGYHGKPVLAAYGPIAGTSLGLVVQMLKQECVDVILRDATALIDRLNRDFAVGSEELELTVMTIANGTKKFTHLSKHKFKHECPNGICLETTPYLEKAKENCSSGVMRSSDYRGKQVIAGYVCIPDMDTFLSVKIDKEETDKELLNNVVKFINERNTEDQGSSDEFYVAQAKPGIATEDITRSDQFNVLTIIKHPEDCLNANCTWDSQMLLRAIQNRPGDLPRTMAGHNYAGIPVTGALDFDPVVGGGIALAMEMDTSQYMAAILTTAYNVVYFTVAMVIFATIVLIWMTKAMMRSMITASDEGKRAVEQERARFGALVASMYPAYVVPRLLSGERHIVAHVRHTAVFFSDIYEFTSASNTISSEELIGFMGYTYGVMDDIAERFNVYKVKTVGDAYLAIAGLPTVGGAAPDHKERCLDMLRFASCVAQVFSHRFNHPEKGKILTVVAGAMSWNKKRRRVAADKASAADKKSKASVDKKGSVAPPGSALDGQSSAWTGKDESVHPASIISGDSRSQALSSTARTGRTGVPQVQCIMSYGIASGPVIAGVLQGKSPMFDIWGKTVNLASRMESTGQPGRIQVSEHVFRQVAALPSQPFQFEEGHKAYCKGFGAVNSYYVRSTNEAPPKDLMTQLGLEPRFGLFYFDNVLQGIQRNAATRQSQMAPKVGSTGAADDRSEASSRSNHRTNPKILNGEDPVDLLDYEDA